MAIRVDYSIPNVPFEAIWKLGDTKKQGDLIVPIHFMIPPKIPQGRSDYEQRFRGNMEEDKVYVLTYEHQNPRNTNHYYFMLHEGTALYLGAELALYYLNGGALYEVLPRASRFWHFNGE